MSIFPSSEEVSKMTVEKLLECLDDTNQLLLDTAPKELRAKMEAIIFRVDMQYAAVPDPVLRGVLKCKALIAAMTELGDVDLDDLEEEN